MTDSIIRRLRKEKGWNQTELAERLGVDVSTVSRYERGLRALSVSSAEGVAMVLGTSTAEILGIKEQDGAGPSGFADDVAPYEPQEGDHFAGLVGPNRYLRLAESNVLDNIGIVKGAVMVVDDSQKARDDLEPLQAVEVAFHSKQEPERAIRLLRQFVPPSLLITNCSTGNLPSLDMNVDDAQIIAIIASVHRKLAGPH